MTNIDFSNVEVTATIISGYVIGLTALVKNAGVSSRWLPVIAILTAMGLSVLIVGLFPTAVFVGLQSAFMAMGIHSGVSAVTKKSTDEFSG